MRRKTSWMIAGVGAAVLLAASPTAAQSPASECELHVYPTNAFAVTENLGGGNLGLVGGLVDAATRLKSPAAVRIQLGEQLSPAEQERVIRAVDMVALLRLPGYRLVIHPAEDQPIWTREALDGTERLAKGSPPCYAELAIISQQYFKQAIGTRLRTGMRYREDGADGRQRLKKWETTATKAQDFPAKSEGGLAASAASIQAAFRSNLLKLATDKLKR